MKRFLFGFLAVLFLILNTIPYLHIMAGQSMNDTQLKQVGAFALSSLITTGEATELDFSDYIDSDTDFLLALGDLVVNGDPTSLIDCGLNWLGGEIDDVYDSAIQSIREWEYNMSPTLYYWFVDTQPPYELSPTYNNIRDLSLPLRRLLTPPDNSPSVNPPIDFNFVTYCGTYLIGASNLRVNLIDTLWKVGDYEITKNTPFSMVSFNGDNFNADITLHQLNDIAFLTQGSIYCTSNGNSYSVQYIGFDFQNFYPLTLRGSNFSFAPNLLYNINAQRFNSNNLTTGYINKATFRTSFDSLSVMMNYFYNSFRACNIYVDGVPYALVNNPVYPITIPDQLTIWNDQPLTYEFPSDTYLKLPDLTNIITNAINNSGVVMWSDIADCFVDVNGQTAIVVTKIVRNDYDNLYMEQYPYPAMLPGMTEQTKFNEHLLDNSHAYLSPMGTVVQETLNVIPSELVGVLAIGAILTIFAVIINRLLE